MGTRHRRAWGAGIAVTILTVSPASARAGPGAPEPATSGDAGGDAADAEIVVKGQRPPGSVVGDIPPELQYGPADVRAYGVGSVDDLLAELAPEIRSDRGRGGEAPVVLVNGRRISSPTEIRDVPTEAIQRVEILPEEVALKYGYGADQRVVNIVLRRRFRAVTGQGDASTSTEGGGTSGTGDLDLLRIHGDDRFNLDGKITDTAPLTDRDRGVVSADPADPADVSSFRTLVPSIRKISLNGVLAHPLSPTIAATLNATFDGTRTASLRGLVDATPPSDADALAIRRDVRTLAGHLGFTVNADLAKWRLSLTGGYDHGETRTGTGDGARDSASSRARSISNAGNVQLVANGPLVGMPAGPLAATVKLGWQDTGFDARSTRFAADALRSLGRRDTSGELSLDLPIASVRNHVLAAIGSLSANLNLAADRTSDFGTLTTLGYGLHWTPRPGIDLIASATRDRNAPTVQQLGDPATITPDVRVFDYRTGATVDVVETAGGNAALTADKRHVEKFGLTLKPLSAVDLTLSANYVRSSIRHAIAAFPSPGVAIEAAFPDRFTRDADGDLQSIDVRPVNLAREDRQELRWGINYTRTLKTSRKLVDAYRAPRRQAGDALRGAAGGGSRGGFGGRGDGGEGGRLQLSIYHTWYFRDDMLTSADGPRIDLLNGGTIGSGGGQPRHEVDLQLGYRNNGIGARLTGKWQSATAATGGDSGELRFGALATANLRLFADLGQQPALIRHHWTRGMRVAFAFTNIFDTRQHVRDATGATPLAYQPGILDPLGRAVRISLRKLFF